MADLEQGFTARRRPFGLLASVAVHVVIAGLLVLAPVAAKRKSYLAEMQVLRKPPPAAEPPRPDEPKPEPPKPKAPKPKVKAPEPVAPPPELPPPTFNMDNRSFAKSSGQGASWSLDAAEGDSKLGVVRSKFSEKPKETALPGLGTPTPAAKPPDFSPVGTAELESRPEVTRSVLIPYPEEARRKNIEGTVIVSVEVKKDGTVRNVRLLSDPGAGLGQAALEALKKFTFSPARDKKGRAVDYRLVYKYRFVLNS